MSRPRVKIAHLLLVVLASGAAMGALKTPTPLVASAVFTAMLLVLIASMALAAKSQEPARRFWLGFAVFGWAYAILSFGPGLEQPIGEQLVTNKLLESVAPAEGTPATSIGRLLQLTAPPGTPRAKYQPAAHRNAAGGAAVMRDGSVVFYSSTAGAAPPQVRDSFLRIGRALAVLVVALAGGLFMLVVLAPRRQASPPSEVSGTGDAPTDSLQSS